VVAEQQERIVYGLDDGGRVTIEDAEKVAMGDRFVHRHIVYEHDGDADRPATRIEFEVRDKVPICTSFAMWSPEGSHTHVRARDLSTSGLDRIRDKAYAITGVFTPNPAGGWTRPLSPETLEADAARVKRAASPPKQMTTEFLARVAEIHNNTPRGNRIEAIRAAMTPTKDTRTVQRWIKKAREEKLIDGDD
jgi:hypothetical protein